VVTVNELACALWVGIPTPGGRLAGQAGAGVQKLQNAVIDEMP
jgi:hypothetical protein